MMVLQDTIALFGPLPDRLNLVDLPTDPLILTSGAITERTSIVGPRTRGLFPARIMHILSVQHLRIGDRNRARFACTRRNTAAWGLPLDSRTHTFRTVTRTSAPIFNSFKRIV